MFGYRCGGDLLARAFDNFTHSKEILLKFLAKLEFLGRSIACKLDLFLHLNIGNGSCDVLGKR